MNKKTMLIGLGVLAVAGIGYYMWKKKQGQGEEKKSNFREGSQDYYDCIYRKTEGGSTAEAARTACLSASVRTKLPTYSTL